MQTIGASAGAPHTHRIHDAFAKGRSSNHSLEVMREMHYVKRQRFMRASNGDTEFAQTGDPVLGVDALDGSASQ